jgi:hypothetical protein
LWLRLKVLKALFKLLSAQRLGKADKRAMPDVLSICGYIFLDFRSLLVN